MAELFIKQAKEYANGRPTYPDDLFEFILSKTQCLDLAWDVATGSGQAIPPRKRRKSRRMEPTYDAKAYSGGRPDYPDQLFQFIAGKTPSHHLAWDVATGTGQAIPSLAGIYKNVIGTDISPTQIQSAPNLPNVKYYVTPPVMSISELAQYVEAQSSVDLITIAQAIHWFDLPNFYNLVKWALKKPNGAIAAWCYTTPQVSPQVDAVFRPYYLGFSGPGWDEVVSVVDGQYRSLDFPFEPVGGLDNTGPFEFWAEKVMKLEDYMAYLRSWSSYNAAKAQGVEKLGDEIVEKFKKAWNCDGKDKKVVKFPIFLRLGRVGNT